MHATVIQRRAGETSSDAVSADLKWSTPITVTAISLWRLGGHKTIRLIRVLVLVRLFF